MPPASQPEAGPNAEASTMVGSPGPSPPLTREQRTRALAAAARLGLPNLDQTYWEDVIHAVAWEVGRPFGFQAFNPKPKGTGQGTATDVRQNAFTPATIFVAGDHLCSLILKDFMPRIKGTSSSSDPERFAKAVWGLHTQIFYNYECRWCSQVKLVPRTKVATEALVANEPLEPLLWHGLLCELVLFFLMHTESINLRHAAETMWFLFWAFNTSPLMVKLWQAGPSEPVQSGRDRRIELRNLYMGEIADAVATTAHVPSPLLPQLDWDGPSGAGAFTRLRMHLASSTRSGASPSSSTSASLASPMQPLTSQDVDLLTEMAASGDGGLYTDRIVSPIFTMLAHEMDYMTTMGEEVPHRIGYDDLNESCCDPVQVHAMLKVLGMKRAQRNGNDPTSAYHALLLLGCKDICNDSTLKADRDKNPKAQGFSGNATRLAAAAGGATATLLAGAPGEAGRPGPMAPPPGWPGVFNAMRTSSGLDSPLAGGNRAAMAAQADAAQARIASARPLMALPFDVQRAANWWCRYGVIKTFRERRTCLAVYRAFYRVFALHLVGFQLLLCQAFDPWNRNLLSTTILTHALLQALERFANWWISRSPCSPLAGRYRRDRQAIKDKRDAEMGRDERRLAADAPTDLLSEDPRYVRTKRPSVKIEGAPAWGVFGFLEWWILLFVLIALFILQHVGPWGSKRRTFQTTWMWITWGYPALILLHFFLTTRDGYCISLTHALWLPGFITASSSRPTARRWIDGRMRMGWNQFMVNTVMWLLIMGAKFTFDYYALCRPLVEPIRDILKTNWLQCVDSAAASRRGFDIRCVDGSWILVAARVSPFFVMSLLDTNFFYSAVLTFFGVARGLLQLDLGLVSTWTDVCDQFHRTPERWWTKCTSEVGHRNAMSQFDPTTQVMLRTMTQSLGSTPGLHNGQGPAGADAAGGGGASHSSNLAALLPPPTQWGGSPAPGQGGAAFIAASTMAAAAAADAAADAARATIAAHAASSAAAPEQVSGAARPSPRVSGSGSRTSEVGLSLPPFPQIRPQAAPGSSLIMPQLPLPAAPAAGSHNQLPILPPFPPPATAVPPSGGRQRMTSAPPRPLGEAVEADCSVWGARRSLRLDDVVDWSGSTGSRAATRHAGAGPVAEAREGRPQEATHVTAEEQSKQKELATWSAFASAWDEIVTNLRDNDLISDREDGNLRFLRLDARIDPTMARGSAPLLRPVLLPTFFYAGKLQNVIDTGVCKAPEVAAINELVVMSVALLSGLGMLTESQAAAITNVRFNAKHTDLQHQDARLKGLQAALELVDALLEVSQNDKIPEKPKAISTALDNVLKAMQVECIAVKSWRMFWTDDYHAANDLLAVIKQLRAAFVTNTARLVICLRSLLSPAKHLKAAGALTAAAAAADNLPQLQNMASQHCNGTVAAAAVAIAATAASSGRSHARDLGGHSDAARLLLRQVLQVLKKMMSVTPRSVAPQSEEARRVLGFFINSLGSGRLPNAPTVNQMRSLVTMTPCYEEDVLYALDTREAATKLGLSVSEEQVRTYVDLLTDSSSRTEEGMTLISYLQSLFPIDYDNLMERVRKKAGVPASVVLTEQDFRVGRRLADHSLELQMWASNRGQLLARTAKGMVSCGRAFKVLTCMEHPKPSKLDEAGYNIWVDTLVAQKFTYLVAAQVYSKCLKSKDLRHRWLAESTNVLLRRYPLMRVAYLDTVPSASGTSNYSVCIRGSLSSDVDVQAFDPRVPFEAMEVYRVRLPTNNFTGKGIIIGEGKPENQNHAVIFAFGEALQAIDMNQDNYLAEALKMRNLLVALDPTDVWRSMPKDPWQKRQLSGQSGRVTGAGMMKALQRVKDAQQPTVLVGFREWIFSEKAGALGSYAAAAEFAFGTIFQRIMSWPGGVRMHYGHPDVWNKMETMTQGGMSRATRTIHVSEDVFSGYNHTLRGARIKYEEFISCGKGRDMGFDSINVFEAKISGGGGETLISREMMRIGPRMDIFRLLHLYFSGSGYFINNLLLFITSYLLIYSILLLVLARANDILVKRTDANGNEVFTATNTVDLNFAVQIGLISNMPYMGQLMLETGAIKTLITVLLQIISGSIMFFIFRQLTSAHYFFQDLMYGGASYISTGRGFNLQASTFVKVYSNYARTHLYFAFELLLWLIVLAISMECNGKCNYPGLTWGTYMVAVSLLLAPFWFNPLSFDLQRLRLDLKGWSIWLYGGYEPSVKSSWNSWNRAQNERIRNIYGRQTDRWLTDITFVLAGCVPVALLAVASVSRLTVNDILRAKGFPLALRNKWLVFLIWTSSFWLLTFLALWLRRVIERNARAKTWRLLRLVLWIAPMGLLITYLVLSTYIYDGVWGTLAIMVYTNFNLYLFIQRALLHAAPGWTPAVDFVNYGFWVFDFLGGYFLLACVTLLSLIGIAHLQTQLLFSRSFVRFLAEGRVLRLLAPRMQVNPAADVLAGSGGSGGPGGGGGGSRHRTSIAGGGGDGEVSTPADALNATIGRMTERQNSSRLGAGWLSGWADRKFWRGADTTMNSSLMASAGPRSAANARSTPGSASRFINEQNEAKVAVMRLAEEEGELYPAQVGSSSTGILNNLAAAGGQLVSQLTGRWKHAGAGGDARVLLEARAEPDDSPVPAEADNPLYLTNLAPSADPQAIQLEMVPQGGSGSGTALEGAQALQEYRDRLREKVVRRGSVSSSGAPVPAAPSDSSASRLVVDPVLLPPAHAPRARGSSASGGNGGALRTGLPPIRPHVNNQQQ